VKAALVKIDAIQWTRDTFSAEDKGPAVSAAANLRAPGDQFKTLYRWNRQLTDVRRQLRYKKKNNATARTAAVRA
jgi:hypothetical protein